MHVTVEVEGSEPTWPRSHEESNCLAAFLVMVDLATETGITQRSFPELLDPPQNWDLYVGIGLPRRDDPEVHEAVRAWVRWADGYATRERRPNPLGPFQRFAPENPPTDEGRAPKYEVWQKSGVVASACWALREAIRAEPSLQVLDTKFPLLASPALPNRPKGNLDALQEIALGASGHRLRLLLVLA